MSERFDFDAPTPSRGAPASPKLVLGAQRALRASGGGDSAHRERALAMRATVARLPVSWHGCRRTKGRCRSMIPRFSRQDIERWREEGFAIIERFFGAGEYGPVLEDFEALYRDASQGGGSSGLYQAQQRADDGSSRARQFLNIHVLPYEGSSAINLLSLHPALIAFARALLGVADVRLYQSHTWAKYTGQADYDQEFHCDYGNHTLLAPAEDPALRTVDFVIYLTDVTIEHGAMRVVTKPDVLAALGRPALSAPSETEQAALRAVERAVVVPAGSLIAHGIDTMHRGSNLTAPSGRRFSMTAGYKAAGSEHIGFHVWQSARERPWHRVFAQATPEQLACLGVPRPGHPYWTRRTLELSQARWPGWNMEAYVAACSDLER